MIHVYASDKARPVCALPLIPLLISLYLVLIIKLDDCVT